MIFRSRLTYRLENLTQNNMRIKDFNISTLLKIGFLFNIFFIIVIGIVAALQNHQLGNRTDSLYNHPFQVRTAIGKLNADVLSMRLATRNLIIDKTERDKHEALQLMEMSAQDAKIQFDVLKNSYLGPKSDVEAAYAAFVKWKIARDENTSMALAGNFEPIIESVRSTGEVGNLRGDMLKKIVVIDNLVNRETIDFYNNTVELKNKMHLELLLLIITVLFITIIASYLFLRQIVNPVEELTDAARRYHEGDKTARSIIESKNEFGVLSDTFNTMVDNIQSSAENDEKFTNISQIMLSEEDPRTFFRVTLLALCNHTQSQMAAVYLLNESKTYYDHYESVGMNDGAKLRFSAIHPEGEFGSVIATHKIQFIKKIPHNTRFVFQTVSGKFIPREIISIPVLAGDELIAIISLAAVRTYTPTSLLLINDLLNTLSARVQGILTFRRMRNFSERLEMQNTELEQQKSEMTAQSIELSEQNRELEIQKKQLKEANRLKTNFLSNMSHELRTPLNSVIALSGVLNRRLANKIDEDEFSYIGVIERNGKHLLSLINDILDISRIESGREEVEITRFNPKNLVAEVATMIKPQVDPKKLELLQTGDNDDVYLISDMQKCQHILQNLISNAVKFTEKGTVEIKTVQANNQVIISVADSGIGISADHLPHIFDEFRQADGSTSRKYGGTGLGLAIAKKYANLLGGNISVTSVLEKGSTFTLTLPVEYDAKKRIIDLPEISHFTKAISPVPIQATDTKTVLLVEDSEPAIIQMKDFMEESGYRILVAQDGTEALAIIETIIPDAIIMDLMMPGVDGFEVLKTIRNIDKTAHIPVLILTAKHLTNGDLKFLKRNNVHQLIQKGDVNREDLLTAVVSMVTNHIEEADKPQRRLQTISGKPVVLVVEDNMDNMLTVKAILEEKYTTIEAIDGREGIAMAKKHKPHLILMDIALPGMDGIEAFKAIRKDARMQHIPIIALTASAMTTDRETILAHGFDGYLVKPIEEKVFFKTIDEVLFGK
jgi:signal transduction histidine kinase/DNA-binding response OmpR family regulator/HAMP domain-containing protein